ncbi:MAG: protein-glutamate O-methyltransferase CheR [Candidatus Sericytochromatia bacterium]|nr:protein-glutamate O-methyltransferase CheR [Candidatus Sericytochromatia bacterium]
MPISPVEYDYICQLLKSECAIALDVGKEYLVELRIGILAENEGFSSAQNLIQQLTQKKEPQLVKKVVDAMTTNETLFFRDFKPFELLHKEILPHLFQRQSGAKELNIWSAACSMGQEPYSIAMVLDQYFAQQRSDWKIHLQATDISFTCLNYAKDAVYNQFEVNRGLPISLLVRYFEQENDRWKLKPVIKEQVQFQELNLIEPWPSYMPKMDIIFLRNVLIYFDFATKKKILQKVRQQLKPDGYLFLGNAETTLMIDDAFSRIDSLYNVNCYQVNSRNNQ